MKNFKLRRTAAIIGYTVLAVVLFASCKLDKTKLSELKSPVVIVAIEKEGAVMVKDSTGQIEVFVNSGVSNSLSQSRLIGDTIK